MTSESLQRAAVGSMLALAACSPSALGAPLASTTLTVEGGEIEVEIASGPLDLPRAEVIRWVSDAARGIVAYFGKFPVARYRLVIRPVPGETGVLGGTTWAAGGARSRINLGEHTRVADLGRDWVLTHEMVHTAFPDQPPAHHWIEEGTATYIEPLARSWAGTLSVTEVWADLVDGLPKGLPADGDRGLDRTHTWGRTYWGGALFCMLADIEIRERTRGSRGLVDAMRGILAAGGNDQADWTLERTLLEGDKAIGVPVLQELYKKMKDAPVATDLNAIWRSLGVKLQRGKVELDDTAPRAAIRRAITTRPPK
jgi:hypothetical protein